jgi:predicted enzyme related to lactoylglutathione lyase
MINGVHALVYTPKAEELRRFFRDVLGWNGVDVGRGWMIFALPPAEIAAHPDEGETHTELYLMCDDIQATADELRRRGVEIVRPVADQGWGLVTAIRLPDGSEMGLYEPRHPTAIAQR